MAHDVRVADTRTRLEALLPASERERTGSAENPRLREVLVMTGYTDERLLRLRDVKEKTGLGSSTIYRRIADGKNLGLIAVAGLSGSDAGTWVLTLTPAERANAEVQR
jgi:Prophage CP4-57 regulatory protein (AlpA)